MTSLGFFFLPCIWVESVFASEQIFLFEFLAYDLYLLSYILDLPVSVLMTPLRALVLSPGWQHSQVKRGELTHQLSGVVHPFSEF